MKIDDSTLIYVNTYNSTNLDNYKKEWFINCSALIGFEKT